MTARRALAIALAGLTGYVAVSEAAPQLTVRVVDAISKQPIAGALVTAGATASRTDTNGRVTITADGVAVLKARALGYQRRDTPIGEAGERGIVLAPLTPKAVYLSVYGIGDRRLRNAALDLIDRTELNALVIDVKGDRGLVPYRSTVSLASSIGAQRVITVADLPGLAQSLHQRGVYMIARIVVFKDTLLAQARPDLALRRLDGTLYLDREGLAWANPHNREVWRYNVALAVEAAAAGFDEIQFDYVRLPDTTEVAYDVPWTEEHRTAAIDGFLAEARKALVPYNVFLSADVFGYVCWNSNDTRIGQKLEQMVDIVDYLSPMLYPSSFQFGIPGCRNPAQNPYEIVRRSLEHTRERTGVPPVRFRPWLQAFADYGFGAGAFTSGEVRAQIRAADDFGANGWMLWNPRNRYSAADLRP